MKLKVGDKVTVRKDLKTGWYGDELVVPEMLVLAGKTVVVEEVSDGSIYISGSSWNWTPEMFQEKPSEITLEIGYRFLTDTHVRASSQTVTNDDYAYENACEQFLEEYMKDYDYVEGVDICFVREASNNA
ncbi:hypothetical protein [Enterococcus phage vB_EfaS_IME198]|uniref:hypothetical protein n=1 Tax=Enterococcus phage vB_EfaS_IME198 TaxID=1747287 RepID=UPI00071FF045|nr:hypothetical protein AVT94_gp79 [Enterococcus phage vB_EfaS_IME198]ALO80825.1 hypothetical protein [Enterococcus phage vB_EfaS_IME198]